MKLSTRYIILCLFTLSSAFGRAESVEHDFDAMFEAVPPTLVMSNELQTGTTDFCTYTCSGGAYFSYYSSVWSVCLDKSGRQVTTTQIHNLDSIRLMYLPADIKKTLTVKISQDSVSWTDVTVKDDVAGVKTVKMPTPGDYYVRFIRKNDVYLKLVKYIYFDLSDCPNCFLYRSE